MTAGIVTQFQGEAPLEGLAVGDLRFGLDPCLPMPGVRASDLGVPGSEVSLDRQRHLRPPANDWMEARAKPLQEGKLRPIPDRIARWKRPDREIEPKNREPRPHLGNRRPIDLAALKSAQLASRAARGSRAVAEAEPGCDACVPVVLAETKQRRPHAPSSAIVRPFPGTHRRAVSRQSLDAGLPRPLSRLTGQRMVGTPDQERIGAVLRPLSRHAGLSAEGNLSQPCWSLPDRPLSRHAGRQTGPRA